MTFHSLRFGRAAASYETHSRIQERMAGILTELGGAGNPTDGQEPERTEIKGGRRTPEARPGRILEMGCGTGLLTRNLVALHSDARLIATDASPRMIETARTKMAAAEPGASGRIHWLVFEASGETRAQGEASAPESVREYAHYDLAASNALVQWFPDLRRHFAMVGSLLAPAGAYLVSGFARDNFPELNAILREPPFCYAGAPGHARDEIEAAASQAGFAMETWKAESVETVLPSARDFLESIKALGSARRPEEGRPLTRERLGKLIETYQERYGCPGGVRATWKPWYAALRMPA